MRFSPVQGGHRMWIDEVFVVDSATPFHVTCRRHVVRCNGRSYTVDVACDLVRQATASVVPDLGGSRGSEKGWGGPRGEGEGRRVLLGKVPAIAYGLESLTVPRHLCALGSHSLGAAAAWSKVVWKTTARDGAMIGIHAQS